MKRLSFLTLWFAVLSFVFLLSLIVLRFQFPPYPLLSYQDVADLFTPLALIPLYWLMFRHASSREPGTAEALSFMVLAALWVLGHGMHLAANSVSNLSDALARQKTLDITATPVYTLTYFFDEILSHSLWYGAMAALALLILYREWRQPAGVSTLWAATLPAGVLYGFTLFCTFVEAQAVAIGLPFVVVVSGIGLARGHNRLAQRPLLAFFFVASLLAFVLFAAWGLYWRGFPEFSDVGLI
jgi:hypothetical protein